MRGDAERGRAKLDPGVQDAPVRRRQPDAERIAASSRSYGRQVRWAPCKSV